MSKIWTGFTAQTMNEQLEGPAYIVIDYTLPGEKALGATEGGNEFDMGVEYRNVTFDTIFDEIVGSKRIANVKPMIKSSLKQWSAEVLQLVTPGLTVKAGQAAVATVLAEYVGSGDAIKTVFTLDQGTATEGVLEAGLEVYFDGVLQTSGYTLLNVGDASHSGAGTAELVFDAAVSNAIAITANYTFETGSLDSHQRLSLGEINELSLPKNIAMISGVSGYANPAIFWLYNPWAQMDGALSFGNKEEVQKDVDFMGRVTPEDLVAYNVGSKTLEQIMPFDIDWPVS